MTIILFYLLHHPLLNNTLNLMKTLNMLKQRPLIFEHCSELARKPSMLEQPQDFIQHLQHNYGFV